MRILVVDDDPLAGEMTGALLEFQGHDVLLANDAMEATSQLDAHDDIALIVSDMHMPLINGIELLEMLREQGVTLPFILLTGDMPNEQLHQTSGLSACLQKDAALETTLEHAVAQALGS
ncbi:response regulator [Vreelandella lionensis]|uniref:Response regulator n=1 Tax=Vreelandella lionensis TaxID=1144478 RepID=A0ABW8BUD4_9GAMM